MDILLTNIWRFFDPLLFCLVSGGVFTLAWVQNGMPSLALALTALAKSSRDPFAESGENSTFMCRRIDFTVREQGFQALEAVHSQDDFVGQIMVRLINAQDAKSFEEWARLEQHVAQKKLNMAATYWNSAAEVAPAIGLIGTIIGLIQLFAIGIDPLKMGPAMSFTLLTSLYGLFISHIIAYPIYVRLHARAEVLNQYRSAVVHHVIALAKREFNDTGPVHFSPVKSTQKAA